jgi:nitrogenase iron protein NifH
MSQQIAIYSRGGGSTLAVNISAALADEGFKIIQVGCDPRRNSCSNLHTAININTVMDLLNNEHKLTLERLIVPGYKGISCIELGDPFTNEMSASENVAQALLALEELIRSESLDTDIIIYDIPLGAFTPALMGITIHQHFLVISPEALSFSMANRMLKGLTDAATSTNPPAVGLIANGISNPFDESFVTDFARKVQVQLGTIIPRSLTSRQCELYGETVIEAASKSHQATLFRRLARQMIKGEISGTCQPLSPDDFNRWSRNWGDLLFEMENGLISDGASI